MNFKEKTDFLTPESSFLVGMGTCLNIQGNYFTYNTSESSLEADERAIGTDWKIIGNDLRNAISHF